jgi:hypothetical protein
LTANEKSENEAIKKVLLKLQAIELELAGIKELLKELKGKN